LNPIEGGTVERFEPVPGSLERQPQLLKTIETTPVSIVNIQLIPSDSVANGEFGYAESSVIEGDANLVADLDLPAKNSLSD